MLVLVQAVDGAGTCVMAYMMEAEEGDLAKVLARAGADPARHRRRRSILHLNRVNRRS